MMPQNVVQKMVNVVEDKKKNTCGPLKLKFESCMKTNEDNVIECNRIKLKFEECLRKMDLINYIK